MSSEIIKSQLDVYRENFIENSDSPLGTHQNNITTVCERFDQIIAEVNHFKLNTTSIIDFGAGTGDFYSHAKNKIKM